jgi:hypothetical protein
MGCRRVSRPAMDNHPDRMMIQRFKRGETPFSRLRRNCVRSCC